MSNDDKDTKGTPVAAKQASLPASGAGGVKCRITHGSYKTLVNGEPVTLTEGDECTLSAADANIGVEAGALEKL